MCVIVSNILMALNNHKHTSRIYVKKHEDFCVICSLTNTFQDALRKKKSKAQNIDHNYE